MIEEIKKRLEAGEVVELECVDRGGFLKDTGRREANEKILDQGPLVVGYIDYDGDISLVGGIGDIYRNVIISGELKYFRIKESSATFDDLIDVAVKAHREGIIERVEITRGCATRGILIDGHRRFIEELAQDGINFINSLYTETFVIESVEDTLKIDTSGSEIIKVILANNEVLSSNYLDCLCDISDGFRFKILKGATVTQKRGK